MKKLTCKIIDHSSLEPYEPIWQAMQQFCQQGNDNTIDQLWLMEHQPVYTQGRAGKTEHVLNPNHIPIVQTDRGGQVTYHGPGQLMIYTLLNVERLGLNTRQLVRQLETLIINLLSQWGIAATSNPEAPGVYVDQAKIASIGLRISRGFCYHGLALNVDMDLTPFQGINPCGYKNQAMTQIKDFVPDITIAEAKQRVSHAFCQCFNYSADYSTQ